MGFERALRYRWSVSQINIGAYRNRSAWLRYRCRSFFAAFSAANQSFVSAVGRKRLVRHFPGRLKNNFPYFCLIPRVPAHLRTGRESLGKASCCQRVFAEKNWFFPRNPLRNESHKVFSRPQRHQSVLAAKNYDISENAGMRGFISSALMWLAICVANHKFPRRGEAISYACIFSSVKDIPNAQQFPRGCRKTFSWRLEPVETGKRQLRIFFSET